MAAAEPAVFRKQAQDFCVRELLPHQAAWRETGEVDVGLWRAAGEAGLLSVAVPERLGGGGGTFEHEAVLLEEQAAAGDTAWGIGAHLVVVQCVLTCATEEQRARWLPGLLSGELIGAVAITEPDAGSDLQAVRTTALPSGSGYLLSGHKAFVSNGGQANLVLVFARTGFDQRDPAFSLFALETGELEGFFRGPRPGKIGRRGQDTASLVFDEAAVLPSALVGGVPGRGLGQLLPLVSRERLMLAVSAVATMESVLLQTVQYTRERKVFGKFLKKFQNTEFVLAECAAETAAGRALLDRSVNRYLSGELDVSGAAIAKLWCTNAACRVTDACLQLFGGYGYLDSTPSGVAWADARAGRIFGGTDEMMKSIIARAM